jgi:hypothetical protein
LRPATTDGERLVTGPARAAQPTPALLLGHRGYELAGMDESLAMHDADGSGRGGPRDQTVDALAGILDAATERGLRSVPLSTLL